ncbi:unnamed protein product [Microthlaspi erraticum]|uniref:Uncharacterized protein n=1 Tax=Microthlaspi erraticum TaxID=1685480 RepID=A0A6D2K5F8_9BRAS|nr:unnamed protein product [Microthlaspi erraticum]
MKKFQVLKLPNGQNKPLLYLLTLVPPVVLSLLDPEIFFKALDFAGTYGGNIKSLLQPPESQHKYKTNYGFSSVALVLVGILPAAMSWFDRNSISSSTTTSLPQLVPGGKITLSLVMGAAGYVIISEVIENFSRYVINS